MNELKIKINSKKLTYWDNEKPGHPVIFIHGNSCSKSSFEKQFSDPIFEKQRLIAIDLPGHGSSDEDEKSYSIFELAKLVATFSKELKLESPILAGHSLGGHIAIEATPLMNIAGLIFWQAPPVDSTADMANGFAEVPELALLFTAEVTAPQRSDLAKLFASSNELQKNIEDWHKGTSPMFRQRFGESLESSPLGEINILENLDVPYLCIDSLEDELINSSYIQKVCHENLETMSNCKHFPHFESATLFNRLINAFIQEAAL